MFATFRHSPQAAATACYLNLALLPTTTLGLPSVSASFIDDQVRPDGTSTPVSNSTSCCASPVATMMDMGVASPRQGGNDQHGNSVYQRVSHTRLLVPINSRPEVNTATPMTIERNMPTRCRPVLHRARLRCAHQPSDDLSQQRSAPTRSACMTTCPLIDGRTNNLITGPLVDWHRPPVTIDCQRHCSRLSPPSTGTFSPGPLVTNHQA